MLFGFGTEAGIPGLLVLLTTIAILAISKKRKRKKRLAQASTSIWEHGITYGILLAMMLVCLYIVLSANFDQTSKNCAWITVGLILGSLFGSD